jgi:hypothetical protein
MKSQKCKQPLISPAGHTGGPGLISDQTYDSESITRCVFRGVFAVRQMVCFIVRHATLVHNNGTFHLKKVMSMSDGLSSIKVANNTHCVINFLVRKSGFFFNQTGHVTVVTSIINTKAYKDKF